MVSLLEFVAMVESIHTVGCGHMIARCVGGKLRALEKQNRNRNKILSFLSAAQLSFIFTPST